MQATARFSGHCTVYSSAIKPSFFSPISTRLPRPHPPPFLSYRPISLQIRPLSATMRSNSSSFSDPAIKLPGSEPCLRAVIAGMEKVYFSRNPTAQSILDLVRSHDGDHVFYDHVAFRTFGVDGHGIDSIAKFFLDFGYVQRDELRFPAKKLKALWFSPPQAEHCDAEPLPRVFISELLVDEMSPRSQEIIRKYTQLSGGGYKHAALASTLGCLTWGKPLYSDYELLSRESEYAAWTLVNGYALNHVTISTHRLKSEIRDINSLNRFLEDQGFKLNSDGGVLKVSPDGLLLQSSTVADSTSFTFADGVTESVPCCYIEFAERLLLPQYTNLAHEEIKEFHRRDGFEVGNADKIFESTSKEQLTRKAT
ncbi:Glyoxalase/Bleomycin resistance protein/Dihydroxybiphenyl dioxygenase protein [Dioscorea alata]|uniref:Glyoxalase/Bleomycin resistance protein/Dihydroxybiphenyl dioxygenase protein n=1 Tax=Dioscorea alata TaxID=55571 RepID=A0ACB7UAP2_DIOAL|nr:Glyoxalase/Bleomycin resistance protein/Dihydroxybiphenyl dioxygenase protein [Dioscorea alata]